MIAYQHQNECYRFHHHYESFIIVNEKDDAVNVSVNSIIALEFFDYKRIVFF